MVLLVGFGDQRGHAFQGGEHGQLLPVGVPDQHLVEEPEALDRRFQSGLALSRGQRGRVDDGDIPSEGVVDGYHRVNRTWHDYSPFT